MDVHLLAAIITVVEKNSVKSQDTHFSETPPHEETTQAEMCSHFPILMQQRSVIGK